MGIPIDPRDPVNGGCWTCVPYLPDTLNGIGFHVGFGTYSGLLDVFDDGRWDGLFTSPTGPDRAVILDLCFNPEGRARFVYLGFVTMFTEAAHCDMPMSFADELGNTMVVTL